MACRSGATRQTMTAVMGYEIRGARSGANLRDHMTDLELIFTMLGEASTTEIARRKDAQGFVENKHAAQEGGTIAGDARQALEAKSGAPVLSRNNHLDLSGHPTLSEGSESL